jgi:sec-independent protein translocase protein TatC
MPIDAGEQLTLYEHLDELRKRIFASLIALVVAVVVAAVFDARLFELLLRPLPEGMEQITTFSPAEPFMVSLKVWVIAGIIAVSPYLIYQFWAFVGPAFTASEKHYFVPVVAACSGLFLGGVVFAYLIVLPRGLDFLLNFNGEYFNVQNRASDYFTFVALFVLAFGLTFEMPVVLVLLAKVGVVDDRFLRRNRRYAILIEAVLAAVLTPSQDAFSMLALFLPLVVLYEVSIVLARIVQPKGEERRREEHQKTPPDDDDLSRATV